MPSELIEQPSLKKRKCEPTGPGESSKPTNPQILVAGAEPSQIPSMTIQLNSPNKPDISKLREILEQSNLMSQKLNTWVTQFDTNTNDKHKKGEIPPTHNDQNHLIKEENLALTKQIQKLQAQLKEVSEENKKLAIEKSTYTTALSTSQTLSNSLQEKNTTLENQRHQLQNQLQTAAQKIQELNLAHENKEKSTQHKWQTQNRLILAAVKKMTQIHSTFRTEASIQIQTVFGEMEGYRAEFLKLKVPAQTESERATEIAKIEAFNHWIDGEPATKDQMTAKLLLERVTAKMSHTLHNLKQAINQVTTERDELQSQLEQADEVRLENQNWE